ncbi:MAG TPA: glycosyltransferase family A protein [Solirubrobacteraceae bacterium]|nr:glycosyltransferase family A protein [Solirubrobacteraceae bacterium]
MPATMSTVTVAIPTRNAGEGFEQTLGAIAGQRIESELLICDSGSSDNTVNTARAYGASVIELPPEEFSHGGTRNLLMERAAGDHVAFLTQDAVPADELWLTRLLWGFSAAADVGLVFGPYRPHPEASLMVTRELTQWFASLSPNRAPRVDRLGPEERDLPVRALLGARGYFTDANGCVLRAAWEEVRFRPVAYAEDHVLAHDMLQAGFAKVFMPDAAVIHSHDYSALQWLRRSFDEARALDGIYGFAEQRQLRRAVLNVWGLVGADLRFARTRGAGPTWAVAARSLPHHLARATGTVLGGHAGRLPDPVRRWLSLERQS